MKRQWTPEELIDEWTLHPDDLALIGNKADAGRLGFAVLLKYFQREGRFPTGIGEIPGAIVTFLARQLGVAPDAFVRYEPTGRTLERHRARIRQACGFREATTADAAALSAWLCDHYVSHEHRLESLQEALYNECRARRIVPPTPDRVTRIVRSALRAFETRFYAATMRRLSPETRQELDALLVDVERPADGADGGVDGADVADPSLTGGSQRGAHDEAEKGDRLQAEPPAEPPDDEGGSTVDAGSMVMWDTFLNHLNHLNHLDADHDVELPPAPDMPPDPLDASPGDRRAHASSIADARDTGDTGDTGDTRLRQPAPHGTAAPSDLSRRLALRDVRSDPGPASVDSVLQEIAKLERLRQIGLPAGLFAEIAPQALAVYHQRAAIETPSDLRAHPDAIRFTLLAALCYERQREVTDSLVGLLGVVLRMLSPSSIARHSLGSPRRRSRWHRFGGTGTMELVMSWSSAGITHRPAMFRADTGRGSHG